ncbi:DUF2637 domain-containing protein [Streptomyces daliensis]
MPRSPGVTIRITPAISGTVAVRAGIGLLAAIGFALSYDALRQTAVAIHIRGLLTYAFPLVIDGFIAIGIAALLILRTAPLYARLYVWALVGLATATSIWANALHAVRLNQQTRHENGLHLDDVTVGVLSAIAPLALARVVHLYLLIRRHPVHRHNRAEEAQAAIRHTGHRPSATPTRALPEPSTGGEDKAPDVAKRTAITPPKPDTAATPSAQGRQPSASMDELLAIGRTAPRGRGGRISRRNVEEAIRAAGHTIGKDRLTEATHTLQAEADRHEAQRALANT